MKFRPIYRIALRRSYRAGLLTPEEYNTAMEPLRWHRRRGIGKFERISIMGQVQDYIYSQMRIQGVAINWAALISWIKANWPEILKFIITLLIFLEPMPKES